MKNVIINFSGHTLCSETIQILNTKYDVVYNCEPVNFNFSKEVDVQLQEIISNIEIKIDGSFSLTIIPPGQSTFAILLVSYLHGITGHFPKICYLEMNEDGFYIPKSEFQINVQNVRSKGRLYRSSIY